MQAVLKRMFGCPQGVLGRLGGVIMARMNNACAAWVIDLLDVKPSERILEVGFGPGVAVQRLSGLVSLVAGVDVSPEMVTQARRRNAAAIGSGRVDLRQASAESMPFDDNRFDKALAINSMQIWPDAMVGLREMWRVTKPGGRVALGFTPYSGQAKQRLEDTLTAAGFTEPQVLEKDGNFCVLASKP